MATSASHELAVVRFGVFEVDLRAGELRRNGSKVRLQEQPFQILAMLLERPGKIVTREELRERLWPADTFVDFDHSINAATKRLRDALQDSAENPRFVETLSRRGYRFIAPVNSCVATSEIAIAVVPHRDKSFFLRPRTAIAFVSLIAIAVLIWMLSPFLARPAELIERQLTANSSENSVNSAAISPDGKYLAYSDNTGVFLKVIRTGEVHPVPLPPSFSARVHDWFADGTHLLVSRENQNGKAGLWSLSVFEGAPRLLVDDATGGSVSPDGAHIAFRRGDLAYWGMYGREVWVMRSDGTELVKVAGDNGDGSDVGAPTWSPDGERIAYIRTKWAFNARTSSVEINEWQKARAETLFSESALSPALHWLKDGRLLYARGSIDRQQGSDLWVVSLKQSRRLASSPKRVAGAHGWISQVTASADGKAVIFLRGDQQPSVYIGKLSADGTHLLETRRLTLHQSENLPWSWTPDGKAVLFSSDRNGMRELFKQAINRSLPESLAAGSGHLVEARLSPDGTEILYLSTPKPANPEAPSSIFAIPITGGTPRLVLKDLGIWNLQCAQSPSTICLYSVMKGQASATFRFDARSGRTEDPPQIDPDCNWSLSPDGSQRAIVLFGPNTETIRFRSTTTGEARDLTIKGWSGLMGADWFPDGKSLLVGWHKFDRDSALLRITLDGRATVLLRSSNPEIWGAIPSPDGQMLAIAQAGGTKNVWQLENF
ncbi:MAG TPA: winged helix-turn-helix domain-containing protein [Terriglobales bacterium]|jgi:DNA-binding winged helix-turn-helix (wHTH) protein/Tol biopolymer transport system component|nr:winged helix-turn-helix domain-containing protein [Terriglobales bacterium]